jgi:hypothetical protein
MSIALFKCNDELTQKTVSSMLEKYIITLEMLTKTFIVKIHSAKTRIKAKIMNETRNNICILNSK